MTARPTRLTTTFYASAALSLALGAALLTTALPARAADDDAASGNSIFRGILEGLGLRKDGEAINYQERAPLVIPPSRTLPPPEKSDAVVANNPAWPKDPDVLRQKEDTERERTAIRGAGEQIEHDQRVLRPNELTPGPKPRTARRSGSPDAQTSNTYGFGERLSPSQLGYKGGLFSDMFGSKDDEVAKFTQEPPRASLTAPPPGYQTPSPDQPYGLSKATTKYVPRVSKPEDRGTVD
jgi:hypothetical protein